MGAEGSIFDNKINILNHAYLSGSLKYCGKGTLYRVVPCCRASLQPKVT